MQDAVLDDDERELGVGLLDIGGGTTDIAIFFEGSIRHTAVVGLGGQNITNDIALGLRTPADHAERIKIRYGCAYQPKVTDDDYFEVPGVGGRDPRQVSRSVLAGIIQPRVEEILQLALREIRKTDYMDLMTTGIVITGGCAQLDGLVDLAEQVFDIPVKVGYPDGFGSISPMSRRPWSKRRATRPLPRRWGSCNTRSSARAPDRVSSTARTSRASSRISCGGCGAGSGSSFNGPRGLGHLFGRNLTRGRTRWLFSSMRIRRAAPACW